jgi:hypothetical protein
MWREHNWRLTSISITQDLHSPPAGLPPQPLTPITNARHLLPLLDSSTRHLVQELAGKAEREYVHSGFLEGRLKDIESVGGNKPKQGDHRKPKRNFKAVYIY